MKKPEKLWGGRFAGHTDPAVERFTHSLQVDIRLAPYDLQGSIAHARMLGKTGIIPKSDARRIVSTLKRMLKAAKQNRLALDPQAEDVHTAIQWALERKVGAAAARLHTGRSRNDQVVTALRLYAKDHLRALDRALTDLQRAILRAARRAGDRIMPAYTHLRHAQPVLAAHVLLSYLEALARDRERLASALRRTDVCPLGSGAGTGTGLPIDRAFTARALGFSRQAANSIDAVTDRDFAAEILSNLALTAIHLSRIAEDLLLWSTAEFGFVRLDERWLTGSSMMPQKQNPDFLELIRAGSARVAGNAGGFWMLLKGLSTGYQRDLQGDKAPFFEAFDQTERMVRLLAGGFGVLRWMPENLQRQTADETLYATDLAEYLVERGVPFAEAHRAVGRLFAHADRNGGSARALPLSVWKRFSPRFGADALRLLDAGVSVRRKRSAGSTRPVEVARAIKRWERLLR